jgi:sigma-E factor negative regulatory protein RseA
MSEKLKESLSAVIDGEADEFELRRVLDEVSRNEQLASSWERYHIIGSVLRGERTVTVTGMRERIWAEVQVTPDAEEPAAVVPEPTESSVPPRETGRRWTPFAVAAGVAAAVLVGFVGYSELDPGAPVTVVAQGEQEVDARQQSPYGAVQAVALSNEVTDSDQNRTEAYIVRHYQQIGMDRPGLGFARMVAYERN